MHYAAYDRRESSKLLVIQCLLLAVFVLLAVVTANADPKKKSLNLSGHQALRHATSFSPTFLDPKRSLTLDSVTLVEAVRDQFEIEAVSDSVSNSAVAAERRNSTFLTYRNIYLQRAPELNAAWKIYDENGTLNEMAQKVTVYQGASQLSRLVVNSSFGQFLRETAAELDSWRKTLSLRIGRTESGSLSVGNRTGRGDFLEFSVSSSPRRLLEPRLKLGKNLMFKYDLWETRPMIEYNITF